MLYRMRTNLAQLQSSRQHLWGAEVEQSCLWAGGASCAPCGLSVCTPEPLTAPCQDRSFHRASNGGFQSLYFSTVIFPLEIATKTKNK